MKSGVERSVSGALIVAVCAVLSFAAGSAGPHADDILEIRVAMSQEIFHTDEPVVCDVEVENISDSAVGVVNLFIFPHHFVTFEIRDEEGRLVPYVGGESSIVVNDAQRIVLQPGNWVGQRVQLQGPKGREFEDYGQGNYVFPRTGLYRLIAFYNGCSGCGSREWWRDSVSSQTVEFRIVDKPAPSP